jgi:ubiquinone/menaquinone biosynthesis C-methylase UbiE
MMKENAIAFTAETFDAMVATFETWAEPLTARLAQVALEKTSVRAGDLVLDIGAGTGALTLQAAALGAKVTAVDIAPKMVNRLSERLAPYPESKALVMDGQALAFDDGTFDAGFAIMSATLFPNRAAGLDEAVRVVRPCGWVGIVHWANPYGADTFTILLRALRRLPLPADLLNAPEITVLRSADEFKAALDARGCEAVKVELLDAPSPLPAPETFMDALDPLFRIFPTYSSLDEQQRSELRLLLAEEVRRWIKEDVPAGRTAKAHLAIARRSRRPLVDKPRATEGSINKFAPVRR